MAINLPSGLNITTDEAIDSRGERLSGYYTQSEYDDINRSGSYDD